MFPIIYFQGSPLPVAALLFAYWLKEPAIIYPVLKPYNILFCLHPTILFACLSLQYAISFLTKQYMLLKKVLSYSNYQFTNVLDRL